jgi:hypothetical protein
MARRRVGHPDEETKYYLSNAPEDVGLERMAWAACLRWTIEENFKAAKGEVGLDHYEVTRYRGWYHHVTLAMMALAFLRLTQRGWAGKMPASACRRSGLCWRPCCRDPSGTPGSRSTGYAISRIGRTPLGWLTVATGCVSTPSGGQWGT